MEERYLVIRRKTKRRSELHKEGSTYQCLIHLAICSECSLS